MALWPDGLMALWPYGLMALWPYGLMALWPDGFMALFFISCYGVMYPRYREHYALFVSVPVRSKKCINNGRLKTV